MATGLFFGGLFFGGGFFGAGIGVSVDGGNGGARGRMYPRRRKKKEESVVIRYADFDSREAYAKALAEASVPITAISPQGELPADSPIDDDDEIIRRLFLLQVIQ